MSALQHWLDARTPEAPPALRARIALVLREHPEWESVSHAEALLKASQALLREVLAAEPKDREAALALLAADACITYAFEAAAESPSTFGAVADHAMESIAKLV